MFCFAVLFTNCSRKTVTQHTGSSTLASTAKPIDEKATAETKALFYNLLKLSKDHTLFGHQHATKWAWMGG